MVREASERTAEIRKNPRCRMECMGAGTGGRQSLWKNMTELAGGSLLILIWNYNNFQLVLYYCRSQKVGKIKKWFLKERKMKKKKIQCPTGSIIFFSRKKKRTYINIKTLILLNFLKFFSLYVPFVFENLSRSIVILLLYFEFIPRIKCNIIMSFHLFVAIILAPREIFIFCSVCSLSHHNTMFFFFFFFDLFLLLFFSSWR